MQKREQDRAADEWHYSNPYIARALEEMAQILESHGQRTLRPLLLKRAAVAVRQLDRPVSSFLAREGPGGLAQVIGIGGRHAKLVLEIACRGKGQALQHLRMELRGKAQRRRTRPHPETYTELRRRLAEHRAQPSP